MLEERSERWTLKSKAAGAEININLIVGLQVVMSTAQSTACEWRDLKFEEGNSIHNPGIAQQLRARKWPTFLRCQTILKDKYLFSTLMEVKENLRRRSLRSEYLSHCKLRRTEFNSDALMLSSQCRPWRNNWKHENIKNLSHKHFLAFM